MKIKLKWLEGSLDNNTGVTWGVPWTQGVLKKDESICFTESTGEQMPIETWPTAFWPDGSVKWTAHAASFTKAPKEEYFLSKGVHKGVQKQVSQTIQVMDQDNQFVVDTGKIQCSIGKTGREVIRQITMNEQVMCTGSQFHVIREERTRTSGVQTYKEENFYSYITNAKIEQASPIRCVIKVDGKHKGHGPRQWIPFTLRLYFYQGQESIRMVYTFFYDGNPHMDYIKGLGMELAMPLEGALYNRHVRLGGDTGFFCDSPKNLDTWRTRGKYVDMLKRQIQGERLGFDPEEDSHFLGLLDESPIWSDFKILQDSSEVYTLQKRTKEGCSWLKGDQGRRAMGLVYAGSDLGGIALGVKDFWQKCPSALEVKNMATEEAKLTVWLWSPDGKPMDMRHYDTETHVLSAYEGFAEMRSTPYGIANTNEMTITCFRSTPAHEELLTRMKQTQRPPLLVCEPTYYHDTKVFGVWSLRDETHPVKARLEKELDEGYGFFMEQQEQWKWYGFWDYGDIMRAYDPVRHTWRYDVGGFAWNNNEFDPNIWLWYMFLRSGDPEIFRTAEAFTRHASEVDQYHFGEYAGLGSRHNVMHWGCGCKEARISMTAIHKFYYFLTGDERVGEVLDEVKDADYATVDLDPMRAYFSKGDFPTHTRVGPDWSAFVSNWMTRWERFEDEVYKNKILKGIESINKMPHQMCSGPTHGYDPATNELIHMGDNNSSFHMVNCFGSTVVWLELAGLLNDPKWNQMLADYGAFYLLSEEEKLKRRKDMDSCANWGSQDTVLPFGAFAAVVNDDQELAEKVWDYLLYGGVNNGVLHSKDPESSRRIVENLACPRKVDEIPWANSGMTLRYLFIIICMELLEKWIPDEIK